MELSKRNHPTTLMAIAALHLGLLMLVLVKPKAPPAGTASYMELLPFVPFKPRATVPPKTTAKPHDRQHVAARRQLATSAELASAPSSTPALDAVPVDVVLESAAPDFAAAPKPLDIDQLRKQAARNDAALQTPFDKVREQERRKKSIETVVAAAAKAGARKDCQNGYTGFGILAIIPILYGTVTDKGCKWK